MNQINVNEIKNLSKITAQFIQTYPQAVIYLRGDLGAGKTTFVQEWLKNSGYQDIINSPTYQLINEYVLPNQKIAIHADLYRLSSADELLYLDVDEWQNRADWIFIEWPEKGGDYLPPAILDITLTFNGSQRFLNLKTDK